jgi:hypothetical protein
MRHKVISFLKCIQILFGNNLTGEGIKYLAKAQGRKEGEKGFWRFSL